MPFTAHPEPNMKVTFSGGKIKDKERVKTKLNKTKVTFNVNDSERTDAGEYTIELKNQYGEATATIKVVILGKSTSYF